MGNYARNNTLVECLFHSYIWEFQGATPLKNIFQEIYSLTDGLLIEYQNKVNVSSNNVRNRIGYLQNIRKIKRESVRGLMSDYREYRSKLLSDLRTFNYPLEMTNMDKFRIRMAGLAAIRYSKNFLIDTARTLTNIS